MGWPEKVVRGVKALTPVDLDSSHGTLEIFILLMLKKGEIVPRHSLMPS